MANVTGDRFPQRKGWYSTARVWLSDFNRNAHPGGVGQRRTDRVAVVETHARRQCASRAHGWIFCGVGLAFFFVEIAFIQKFLLFLHHPVLAVAAVLSSFLMFAGLGSYIAGRWRTSLGGRRLVITSVIVIGILGLLYVLVLPDLVFEPLIGAPISVKLAVSIALIGLLAIPMGMPFPLGVTRLDERAEKLIPSAWAINGCASVISAVLATVIAIHFGFTLVVLLAVVLYFLAAVLYEF